MEDKKCWDCQYKRTILSRMPSGRGMGVSIRINICNKANRGLPEDNYPEIPDWCPVSKDSCDH